MIGSLRPKIHCLYCGAKKGCEIRFTEWGKPYYHCQNPACGIEIMLKQGYHFEACALWDDTLSQMDLPALTEAVRGRWSEFSGSPEEGPVPIPSEKELVGSQNVGKYRRPIGMEARSHAGSD